MSRVYTSLTAFAVCAPLFAASAGAADLGGGGYKDGPAAVDNTGIDGFKVGGIMVVMPKYEGSDHYEVRGFPYIFPTFAGGGPGFFSQIDARSLDDVRFTLIERNGFIAGPLAGYSLGRDEKDGDRLEGLGDIDGGAVVGGFVGYHLGPVLLDVSFQHFFDDSDGNQIRFGAEVERHISERVTLTGRIGATYADGNYMQTYFGVSNESALFAPYDADAGFKDVNVEVGIKADLDDRWTARASLAYSRLIGDAADSPLVESDNQFTGLLGVSYKFYTADH